MKRAEEVVSRVVEGGEAGEGGEICSENEDDRTVHVERGRIEGASSVTSVVKAGSASINEENESCL